MNQRHEQQQESSYLDGVVSRSTSPRGQAELVILVLVVALVFAMLRGGKKGRRK